MGVVKYTRAPNNKIIEKKLIREEKIIIKSHQIYYIIKSYLKNLLIKIKT